MTKIPLTVFFLLSISLFAGQKRIDSLFFETSSPPPVFTPPKRLAPVYKLFRMINNKDNERGTILLSIATSSMFGLKPKEEQLKNLTEHVNTAYKKIESDPEFIGINSALPYCFAVKKHKEGHCFIYFPEKITANTKSIVFLHGYGGNFLFYTWVLKETFPNFIIMFFLERHLALRKNEILKRYDK